MVYALLLKENGMGCDYTVGCGLKMVPMGPVSPSGDEIYEIVEFHGLDRIESATVVKIEHVYDETAIVLFGPETEPDSTEDDERAERHRRYLELKREFG